MKDVVERHDYWKRNCSIYRNIKILLLPLFLKHLLISLSHTHGHVYSFIFWCLLIQILDCGAYKRVFQLGVLKNVMRLIQSPHSASQMHRHCWICNHAEWMPDILRRGVCSWLMSQHDNLWENFAYLDSYDTPSQSVPENETRPLKNLERSVSSSSYNTSSVYPVL